MSFLFKTPCDSFENTQFYCPTTPRRKRRLVDRSDRELFNSKSIDRLFIPELDLDEANSIFLRPKANAASSVGPTNLSTLLQEAASIFDDETRSIALTAPLFDHEIENGRKKLKGNVSDRFRFTPNVLSMKPTVRIAPYAA